MLIAFNFASGLIIAYGVVALAIGLGARFAQFDWEHAGQLAASFGSLVFMLTAVMLIMCGMVVAWLGAFAPLPAILAELAPQEARYLAALISLSLIYLGNRAAAHFALRAGERALSAHRL